MNALVTLDVQVDISTSGLSYGEKKAVLDLPAGRDNWARYEYGSKKNVATND